MASISERIADKQSRLAAYKAAELKILTGGQGRTTGEVALEEARLATIQTAITKLEAEIAQLERAASGAWSRDIVFGGRS